MTRSAEVGPGSPTVVIFDESDAIGELLQMLLSRQGYRVIVAQRAQVHSGELDVIAFLQTSTPDAIIWDIAPPYERNWNVFKLLRTVRPLAECGIVLTTTYEQHLAALGARETDAIAIVGKPYSITQIIDAVSRGMAHAHTARGRADVVVDQARRV